MAAEGLQAQLLPEPAPPELPPPSQRSTQASVAAAATPRGTRVTDELVAAALARVGSAAQPAAGADAQPGLHCASAGEARGALPVEARAVAGGEADTGPATGIGTALQPPQDATGTPGQSLTTFRAGHNGAGTFGAADDLHDQHRSSWDGQAGYSKDAQPHRPGNADACIAQGGADSAAGTTAVDEQSCQVDERDEAASQVVADAAAKAAAAEAWREALDAALADSPLQLPAWWSDEPAVVTPPQLQLVRRALAHPTVAGVFCADHASSAAC